MGAGGEMIVGSCHSTSVFSSVGQGRGTDQILRQTVRQAHVRLPTVDPGKAHSHHTKHHSAIKALGQLAEHYGTSTGGVPLPYSLARRGGEAPGSVL